MKPCKQWEPSVIDDKLILECIEEQAPTGEVGRLAREEGIPVEEVEQIRFEYKNILRIDHLWILKSLTKLGLNNNFIEKIEKLETLIHLKELDLSFNKISKIENIEMLINLEKLSFYDNLIEVIENIDTLKKLAVFSIGRNKIQDPNNVFYLRKFKKLTSLNMAGNPCTEIPNFRCLIASYLPNLIYYEYVLITPEEQSEGQTIFSEDLNNLTKVEAEELEIIEQNEKEKADAELHSISFVEYLNSNYLFKKMFENDIEGKLLLEMGEEALDFYDDFEEQFVALCLQLFQVGQEQYEIRKSELDQFVDTVDNAKKENQEKGIAVTEAFLEEKKKIFKSIIQLQDGLIGEVARLDYYHEQVDKESQLYSNLIHKSWKELMKLEIDIYDQIDDINQNFEHIMTDMVNNFIEESQGIFTMMRGAENSYVENIMDCAGKFVSNENNTEEISDELMAVLTDKELLNNTIGGSHDIHLLTIDNREDTLVNRARKWNEDLIANLFKSEVDRNRAKVLEINHFFDIQKEDFNSLVYEDSLES